MGFPALGRSLKGSRLYLCHFISGWTDGIITVIITPVAGSGKKCLSIPVVKKLMKSSAAKHIQINTASFLTGLSGLLKPKWSQNGGQMFTLMWMLIGIDVNQHSSLASAPLWPPGLHRWSIRKLMTWEVTEIDGLQQLQGWRCNQW